MPGKWAAFNEAMGHFPYVAGTTMENDPTRKMVKNIDRICAPPPKKKPQTRPKPSKEQYRLLEQDEQ